MSNDYVENIYGKPVRDANAQQKMENVMQRVSTVEATNEAVRKTVEEFVRPNRVIPITEGGTNATTPEEACANLGAVKKSGDTIKGDLSIDNGTSGAKLVVRRTLEDGSTVAFAFNVAANGACSFLRIVNGVTKTSFLLSDSGIALSAPLPITYGGHGASTPAEACSNLGAVKKSGDTLTGALAFSDSAKAAETLTNLGGVQKSGDTLTGALAFSTMAAAGTTLRNLGLEILTGTLDDVGSSGTVVTFATPFSGVPVVVATSGSEHTGLKIRDITAQGCRIVSGVENNDGVQWIAIYMRKE